MVTEVGPVDNETAEIEVPRGSDRMSEDGPVIAGAIGAEADRSDPGQQHRFVTLGGAKLLQSSIGTPALLHQELGSPPPKARTQLVIDRFGETPFLLIPGMAVHHRRPERSR